MSKRIITGFHGTEVTDDLATSLIEERVTGVLLFDRNIQHPKQLQKLCYDLHSVQSEAPLVIMIDQEGGEVARLHQSNGWRTTKPFGDLSLAEIKEEANHTASWLQEAGIDMNLAPVVDLTPTRDNFLSAKKRTFHSDPERVAEAAQLFIESHRAYGIQTCLKHFPGHASSSIDPHQGAEQLGSRWSEKELIPYKMLIESGDVDAVMLSHGYYAQWDAEWPASMSQIIVHNLLKETLSYRGVILTDCIEMGALSARQNFKESLERAEKIGIDYVLFSNHRQTLL